MSTARLAIRIGKASANLLALIFVFPAAVTCWLEERAVSGAEGVFRFWTTALAIVPGGPGQYLRRAFYHLTLRSCSLTCWIGFGVLFSHRQADVEDEVYIGPYALVGSARLMKGCLIGARASLLSGQAQHQLGDDGRWSPSHATRFQEISVGSHAWIGEAAVVMTDVGDSALVAAGSVVSAAVPAGAVVAGNPARFVRQSKPPQDHADDRPREASLPVRSTRVELIDWLKCLGIVLIVYGHVAGWAPLAAIPPIFSKQLGVAFFLFIAGYSLSRETRSPWRVVYNRLFEVYLFGVTLALLMSAITYTSQGRLQLSNYAPFLLGVNVLFDFFPANPTTWYLGTYLHVVVLWAVFLRRVRVTPSLLIGTVVVEIILRALLVQSVGRFVAYMVLPNWITVFLLGSWYAQREPVDGSPNADVAAVGAGLGLVAYVVGWSTLAGTLRFERAFPFMQLASADPTQGLLLMSAAVSMLYVGTTWLAFYAASPFPAPRLVQFVARNTLIIFLAHMPVVFALTPLIDDLHATRGMRSLILFIVCVPGLALLSEGLMRIVRPREWRDLVYDRLTGSVQPLAPPRALS